MRRRLFNLPLGPELELGPDLPIPRSVWRGLNVLLLVLVPVAIVAGVLANQDAGAEVWGTAAPNPVAPDVWIAGHPARPHCGALYLTSVATKRVTALDRLIPGLLAREVADARVVPLARLYGPHPPTAAQERAQEHRELAVSEAAAPIAAYRALGYAVSIVDGRPRLPYPTTIDDRDLAGGPSAGLMFALAVVDRLTPGGITHGYKIAGTGTIDAAGRVGPIGGARFKVLGAQRAAMRYFFVPARWDPYTTWYGRYTSNYDEATACQCTGMMRLVPVRTLTEALAFLRHLH